MYVTIIMVKFLDVEKIVTFEVNEGNEAFSCYKKKKKERERSNNRAKYKGTRR